MTLMSERIAWLVSQTVTDHATGRIVNNVPKVIYDYVFLQLSHRMWESVNRRVSGPISNVIRDV